jgi:1,4-alpha-glucan branching enzyme
MLLKSGMFRSGLPEANEMRFVSPAVSSESFSSASPAWEARKEDVEALLAARHPDPFAVLGLHETACGFVIRALVPHAGCVTALPADGSAPVELLARGGGFFEGLAGQRKSRFLYRLRASNSGGEWELHDPYALPPVLGPADDYLFVEGTHQKLYERLGAHPMQLEGLDGVHFAVWAPRAHRVSVVGDFNDWDGRRHQMRKRIDSGLWEIFAPGVGEGSVYKYEIVSADGRLLPLKADPYGFSGELRPSTASIVSRTDRFAWSDQRFMDLRRQGDPRRKPLSIYEAHIGSWMRGDGGRFLSYDELAESLIPMLQTWASPIWSCSRLLSIPLMLHGGMSRWAFLRRPGALVIHLALRASSTGRMLLALG